MSGNSMNEILTKLKEPEKGSADQSGRSGGRGLAASIWLPLLLTAIVGVATYHQTEKLNQQTAILSQQTIVLNQQTAAMNRQAAKLDNQTASLKQQTAFLNKQTAVLEQQTTALGLQTAALDQQRNELDEFRMQFDFTVSSEQFKIRRAETIKQFFDEFGQKTELGKKLAIESVRTLLSGDDAARLIGLLEDDVEDGTIKTFAGEALRNIRQKTIAGLYSDQASDRKAAYTTLLERWGKDPALVQHLFAEYNRLSSTDGQVVAEGALENGLYNTLSLLNNIDLTVLRDKADTIEAFAKDLTEVGGKVQERKKKLLDRIDRAK